MKLALLAGLFVYAALFILTTFVPYEQARDEALACGFTEAEIERGLQYAFERRLLSWSSIGMQLLLTVLLACTPFARHLADRLHLVFGQRWLLTVLGVAVFCILAGDILALPFGLLRLEHLRTWELTERPVSEWLRDRLIGIGVSGLIWTGILAALYVLIRRFPQGWWLPATACAFVFALAYAYLQPLVIAPLFNTFTPLRETKWHALEKRVQALIDKADIEVSDILVIDASRQSRHSNAYFAGFGPSQRIVLFDNLLKNYPAEEIESVLAHEIGHWKYRHILKGIALAVPGCLVALFVLSRVLLGAVGRGPWQLSRPADPAGIPLVLLCYFVGTWVALPIQNGVSRAFEREADRTALELAGRPDAFIAAERRLVRDNIGNVAPTPWNVWLFATHPTPVEAIQMANDWRRKQQR